MTLTINAKKSKTIKATKLCVLRRRVSSELCELRRARCVSDEKDSFDENGLLQRNFVLRRNQCSIHVCAIRTLPHWCPLEWILCFIEEEDRNEHKLIIKLSIVLATHWRLAARKKMQIRLTSTYIQIAFSLQYSLFVPMHALGCINHFQFRRIAVTRNHVQRFIS